MDFCSGVALLPSPLTGRGASQAPVRPTSAEETGAPSDGLHGRPFLLGGSNLSLRGDLDAAPLNDPHNAFPPPRPGFPRKDEGPRPG